MQTARCRSWIKQLWVTVKFFGIMITGAAAMIACFHEGQPFWSYFAAYKARGYAVTGAGILLVLVFGGAVDLLSSCGKGLWRLASASPRQRPCMSLPQIWPLYAPAATPRSHPLRSLAGERHKTRFAIDGAVQIPLRVCSVLASRKLVSQYQTRRWPADRLSRPHNRLHRVWSLIHLRG